MEKTLQLFASWGGKGVVVLTPTQPEVLTAAQQAGWQQRHDQVLRLLEQLPEAVRLRDRRHDRASPRSAATPTGFFDATHMTLENQRKMIDAVLREAGDTLR